MAYESFKNSKNKLEKIWDKNEQNTSEIDNNLSKFQVDFSSVSFNKKINTITVMQDRLIETFLNEVIVIDLLNIPEWIVNHINILPIVKPVGDINTDVVTSTPLNLEVGNILFNSISNHWIAKLADNNYQLKIKFFIATNIVLTTNTPLPGNFTAELIPFTLDLSLKIINPRIYENTNFHKT